MSFAAENRARIAAQKSVYGDGLAPSTLEDDREAHVARLLDVVRRLRASYRREMTVEHVLLAELFEAAVPLEK